MSTSLYLPGHRYRDEKADRAVMLILVAVLLTHISLFLFSAFLPDVKPVPPPVKQIVVKTINLGVPPPAPPAVREVEVEEPAPIPVPEPVVEKEIVPEPIPEPVVEIKEEPAPAPPPEPKVEPKPEPVKPAAPKKAPPKPAPKKETPKKKAEPKPKAKPKPKPQPKKPPAKKETPKKTTPKKETPKKVEEKPKAKPKEEAPPKPKVDPQVEAAKVKRRELLAKAQKSIAQINTSDTLSAASAVTAMTATIPGQIDALQVETFPSEVEGKLNSQERSYYDELASRLKLLLRLPEFGEVKIKLTLNRQGKFVKVSIVRAESESNRKYVEKTLPTLKYPAFGDNFVGKDQYTFVISLSNEL